MSSKQTELHEGVDAFDRFKRAMRTIVNVPKSRVQTAPEKPAKRKKSAKR